MQKYEAEFNNTLKYKFKLLLIPSSFPEGLLLAIKLSAHNNEQ